MKFLAVTACPSGVAHTYMSAEALEKAARKHGIEIKVETQGSIGIENQITPEDLIGTDAVILTKDMPIKDEDRFENIPKVKVGVSDAVKKAEAIITKLEKNGGGTLNKTRAAFVKPPPFIPFYLSYLCFLIDPV